VPAVTDLPNDVVVAAQRGDPAASRQIIEALHGSIAAENRRDESGKVVGARFVVRLPKA